MTQDISITLNSSIVYVTGTVNEKDYTFTLSATNENGTVWTATVDRAENDIYNISVTAIDSLGNSSTLTTTVYYGMQSLITDRTEADYLHWRELRDKGYAAMTDAEKAEWTEAKMKGAYNPPYDMNRVGAALNYVRDRLAAASYLAPDVFTAKTSWCVTDVPTREDLTNYLRYVSTVREAMAQFATTPPTPEDTGTLDYIGANNIEQIIIDVDTLITNMLAVRHFCGELYSGEI